MAKQSFWDHPIEKLEEALHLKKQIHALQEKLSSLFGSDDDEVKEPKRRPGFTPVSPMARKARTAKAGKRNLSPEARERISAAQRARWAKSKGATSTRSSAASVASTNPATKGKRTMSPETKAKMAAAMKARWAAARRKGLPGPNARK
jgi:hypothetical protein